MALEEAVQQTRYRPLKRSMALRFALAYLWARSGADRKLFDTFWQCLVSEGMWRFSGADQALNAIYQDLGLKRDHAFCMELWKREQAIEQPDTMEMP